MLSKIRAGCEKQRRLNISSMFPKARMIVRSFLSIKRLALQGAILFLMEVSRI